VATLNAFMHETEQVKLFGINKEVVSQPRLLLGVREAERVRKKGTETHRPS